MNEWLECFGDLYVQLHEPRVHQACLQRESRNAHTLQVDHDLVIEVAVVRNQHDLRRFDSTLLSDIELCSRVELVLSDGTDHHDDTVDSRFQVVRRVMNDTEDIIRRFSRDTPFREYHDVRRTKHSVCRHQVQAWPTIAEERWIELDHVLEETCRLLTRVVECRRVAFQLCLEENESRFGITVGVRNQVLRIEPCPLFQLTYESCCREQGALFLVEAAICFISADVEPEERDTSFDARTCVCSDRLNDRCLTRSTARRCRTGGKRDATVIVDVLLVLTDFCTHVATRER